MSELGLNQLWHVICIVGRNNGASVHDTGQ